MAAQVVLMFTLLTPKILRWSRLSVEFKKYMCIVCGWIYDEELGAPGEGLEAGTKWEDVPLNWTCPDCGASKEDFEMVEI